MEILQGKRRLHNPGRQKQTEVTGGGCSKSGLGLGRLQAALMSNGKDCHLW